MLLFLLVQDINQVFLEPLPTYSIRNAVYCLLLSTIRKVSGENAVLGVRCCTHPYNVIVLYLSVLYHFARIAVRVTPAHVLPCNRCHASHLVGLPRRKGLRTSCQYNVSSSHLGSQVKKSGKAIESLKSWPVEKRRYRTVHRLNFLPIVVQKSPSSSR